MKTLLASLVLFPVLTLGLTAQSQSSLPHIANGGFPGGRITTTFVAFNNSNSDVTVTLILRKNDGSPFVVTIPGQGTDSVFFLSLDPGETQFLQTDGSGDLAEGSALIQASADIGISGIFTIQDDQGNFLTETGVGTSPGFTSAAIAVDGTGTFLTGVGLQNLSGLANQITFTLFDSNGQQQGDPVTRTLGSLGHLGVFATGPGGLFPGMQNFRGKLLMTSNLQFSAVTLRQNSSPLSFTTLPVFSTNSDRRHFELPQFASGGGILTTTFVFFTLGDSPADVTIRLTTGKGQPFDVNLDNGASGNEFQVQVPACGSLFLQTDGTGDVRAGAAQIMSSAPIGVGGIYTLLSGGTFQTETGVGASDEIILASLPVDTTGVFDTGVALFNGGDEASEVRLSFVAGAAGPAGGDFSTTLTLDPGEQTAQLVQGNLFPTIGARRGMLTVDSDGEISAVTIRQNSAPLSFTTLPVDNGAFTETQQGDLPMATTFAIPEIRTNRTLDFQLPGGFSVSGQVGAQQGDAGLEGFSPQVALIAMTAISPSGDRRPGAVASFNDEYEVIVPSGRHALEACYQSIGGGGGLFDFTRFSYSTPPRVIDQDTAWDFDVPLPATMQVPGVLSGLDAFENLGLVLVLFQDSDTDTIAGAEVSVSDGGFTARLPEGDYAIHAALLATFGFVTDYSILQLDLGTIQVNGSQPQSQADVALRPMVALSGQVSQSASVNDFAPVNVAASQFETGVEPSRLCGDLSGFLSNLTSLFDPKQGFQDTYDDLFVEPGKAYNISVLGTTQLDSGELITPFRNVRVFPEPLPLPQGPGLTLDLIAPALPQPIQVTGTVRGPDGQPMEGLPQITFRSLDIDGAENTAYSNGISVVNGSYTVSLLPGRSYLVDVSPPPLQVLPFGGSGKEKAKR